MSLQNTARGGTSLVVLVPCSVSPCGDSGCGPPAPAAFMGGEDARKFGKLCCPGKEGSGGDVEPGGAARAVWFWGRRRSRESGLGWPRGVGNWDQAEALPKAAPASWRLFGEPQGAVLLGDPQTMCQESCIPARSRAWGRPQRCPLRHRDNVPLALGTSDTSFPPARHPPPSLYPLLPPAVPFGATFASPKLHLSAASRCRGALLPTSPSFPAGSVPSRAARRLEVVNQ